MKDSIRDSYVKYIGSMDWNVFGTFTHLIPRTERYNRKTILSFYEKNSDLINKIFFVIEPHVELILNSNFFFQITRIHI